MGRGREREGGMPKYAYKQQHAARKDCVQLLGTLYVRNYESTISIFVALPLPI